jgi:hypothetical protein
MGSIHEKNQGPKISCYCTFKGGSQCSIQDWKVNKGVTVVADFKSIIIGHFQMWIYELQF